MRRLVNNLWIETDWVQPAKQIKVQYDFAEMGGAIGEIQLLELPKAIETETNIFTLPSITRVVVNCGKKPTSENNTGQISFNIGGEDLCLPIDANGNAQEWSEGIQDGDAVNILTIENYQSERTINAVISEEALTGGIVSLIIDVVYTKMYRAPQQ